jgi:hypothetical protein
MGMINLIQLATGASTDYVTGAFTGLILPSGDGHVDNMIGYRAIVANFGSTTTVDNVYLFKGDLPAGNPATNCWGIYMKDAPYNWLQSGLKIGGTAGSSDMTAQSLEVEGASLFNGNIGFYNTAPIAQPTSSGAATAGALYTATEQAMLQEAYDALRALGLMS